MACGHAHKRQATCDMHGAWVSFFSTKSNHSMKYGKFTKFESFSFSLFVDTVKIFYFRHFCGECYFKCLLLDAPAVGAAARDGLQRAAAGERRRPRTEG